jgi:sulfite reductase (NADPH) flavoprotein alpha-component
MTISIWRYSHLALAISAALFILIASITGIILAFEPISEKHYTFYNKNMMILLL